MPITPSHSFTALQPLVCYRSDFQMAARGIRNAEEQERGESVAEFSIGNAHREWGEARAHDRRISEYSTVTPLVSYNLLAYLLMRRKLKF